MTTKPYYVAPHTHPDLPWIIEITNSTGIKHMGMYKDKQDAFVACEALNSLVRDFIYDPDQKIATPEQIADNIWVKWGFPTTARNEIAEAIKSDRLEFQKEIRYLRDLTTSICTRVEEFFTKYHNKRRLALLGKRLNSQLSKDEREELALLQDMGGFLYGQKRAENNNKLREYL